MNCEQAQQLFDAYLDGELSPALTTELGAHRLQCPDCRRALALLEVTGHVLSTDREPDELPVGFTDRLLACVDEPRKGWSHRLPQRLIYVGVPVAAAAMVALAFLGFFDRPSGEAAGEKAMAPPSAQLLQGITKGNVASSENALRIDETPVNEQLLAEWLERTREHIAAQEQAGESLQKMMDMTILQLLDVLQQAQESRGPLRAPGEKDAVTAPPPAKVSTQDVEDL